MTEDDWANEQLVKQLSKAEQWATEVGANEQPWAVEPASVLYGDDGRSHPYQLSHAAWAYLFYAVDHLNAARLLVVEAQVVPAVGLFSLFRGALETASVTVYLLAPEQQDERLMRRVRIEAAESRNDATARRSLGEQAPAAHERTRRMSELAQQMGLPDHRVDEASRAEIVETAGRESPIGDHRATLAWKLCSGYAHGDRWSTLAASERTNMPGAPEGVMNMRLAAKPTSLWYATWTATQMVERAWELYDLRRSLPADSSG